MKKAKEKKHRNKRMGVKIIKIKCSVRGGGKENKSMARTSVSLTYWLCWNFQNVTKVLISEIKLEMALDLI